MPPTTKKKKGKQSNYLLPPHVDSLVRAEAKARRIYPSKVAGERLAKAYGVPVSFADAEPSDPDEPEPTKPI